MEDRVKEESKKTKQKNYRRQQQEAVAQREKDWARQPKNHAFCPDGEVCYWCNEGRYAHRQVVDARDGVRKVVVI
jgi:hypothetical protein